MVIKTGFSHQGFTLLGRSSIVFTIILLIFYSTSFWFSYNAAYFGPLAILISLLMTHCILATLESDWVCKLCSRFLKGKPVIVYRNWLKVEENTISFGLYKLLYRAIDKISISPFGNLIFQSNALSGAPSDSSNHHASIILKLPISAINLAQQKEFLFLLKEKCPKATFSRSVEVLLAKPVLNSTNYIHILTVIIFTVVLFDVGHSTFQYIELLKRYYLCQKSASEGHIEEAKKYFESAELLKASCSGFSLVTPKLLNNSSTAASLLESRSKALWVIGDKPQALHAQVEAVKLAPKSFKINLRLARLYATLGKNDLAQETIDSLNDKHKHALLPKLYTASLLLDSNSGKAISVLKDYLSYLDKDYFEPPPIWPPVGEDAVHELFVRDDLQFLISKLESHSQPKN